MKKIFSLLGIGLLSAQLCFAAGATRITLNDGTTIYGKVVGMADGVYTIETETMGNINVKSDKIVEITTNNSASPKTSNNAFYSNNDNYQNYNNNNQSYNNNQNNEAPKGPSSTDYSKQQQEANTMVKSMMMNENFMENIMNLNENSARQSVLNDPEVMEAIQNGDYEFLMNNPKMNDLMNSSEIQDILGGM